MYGMINKAIQELLTARLGEAAWKAICVRTNTDPTFVTMAKYPDEVTYNLMAAASEALGLPADTLLEQFGEYWTLANVHQAILHEKFMLYWVVKGNAPSRCAFVRDTSSLGTRHGSLGRFPRLGRVPFFRLT